MGQSVNISDEAFKAAKQEADRKKIKLSEAVSELIVTGKSRREAVRRNQGKKGPAKPKPATKAPAKAAKPAPKKAVAKSASSKAPKKKAAKPTKAKASRGEEPAGVSFPEPARSRVQTPDPADVGSDDYGL